MRDSRPMRMVAISGFATLLLLAAAAPGRAACGLSAEFVARADVAFVGTLAFASADGTVGRFNVEDVWKSGGLALASPVSVTWPGGGFTMPPPGVQAQRYLVLAQAVGGVATLTGDNCGTFAYPWDTSYAAFRPVDTPPPSAAGETARPVPLELIAVVAAMAVLVLGAIVAFGRRPDPGNGPK